MPKYTMSSLIRKYYESWLNGPTLFDHPNDEERFYRFTKACLKYGRKHYDGQWLLPPVRKSAVLAGEKMDRGIEQAEIGAVSEFLEIVLAGGLAATMGMALLVFG